MCVFHIFKAFFVVQVSFSENPNVYVLNFYMKMNNFSPWASWKINSDEILGRFVWLFILMWEYSLELCQYLWFWCFYLHWIKKFISIKVSFVLKIVKKIIFFIWFTNYFWIQQYLLFKCRYKCTVHVIIHLCTYMYIHTCTMYKMYM